MTEWIQQNYGPILTILGCIFLFFLTLVAMGHRAYKAKKKKEQRRRVKHPKAPSSKHLKVVDIPVFVEGPGVSPEVQIYFYTEKKFETTALVMESLYKVLSKEEYYDFETFDSFIESVNHFVTLSDKRNRQVAEKLRKTAKRKRNVR